MAENRKALHAYVSDEAHDHWHGAAVTWGISVSALLEALSPELGEIDAALGDRGTNIVKASRRIDAGRRRRRRS